MIRKPELTSISDFLSSVPKFAIIHSLVSTVSKLAIRIKFLFMTYGRFGAVTAIYNCLVWQGK